MALSRKELLDQQQADASVAMDYLMERGWEVALSPHAEEGSVDVRIVDPRLGQGVAHLVNSIHQAEPLTWTLTVRAARDPKVPVLLIEPDDWVKGPRTVEALGVFPAAEAFEERVNRREIWSMGGGGATERTPMAATYLVRPPGQPYSEADLASNLPCPEGEEYYVVLRVDETRYISDNEAGQAFLDRWGGVYGVYLVAPHQKVFVASMQPSAELHLVDYLPKNYPDGGEEIWEEWQVERMGFMQDAQLVDYMGYWDMVKLLPDAHVWGCYETAEEAIEDYHGNPVFNPTPAKQTKKLKSRLLR